MFSTKKAGAEKITDPCVYWGECNYCYLLMFSVFGNWKPIRLKAVIYPTEPIQTTHQEFKHTATACLKHGHGPHWQFNLFRDSFSDSFSSDENTALCDATQKPSPLQLTWKAFTRHYGASVVINSTLHLKNTNYRLSFSSITHSNISSVVDNKPWNPSLRQKISLQDHALL